MRLGDPARTDALPPDRVIIRYLLGVPSARARRELEERLLKDPEFLTVLLAVEDELIDRYIGGELSPRDRERFQSHFLVTPERREKLRFAKAWLRRASEAAGEVRPEPALAVNRIVRFFQAPVSVSRAALAAAVAAVLVLATLLGVGLRRTDANRTADDLPLRLREADSRHQRLSEELKREREKATRLTLQLAALEKNPGGRPEAILPPQDPAMTVAITLLPGLVRGSTKSPTLWIPPQAATVRLKLDVGEDDSPVYRVTVRTLAGEQVWIRDGLKALAPGSRAVVVDVPSAVLQDRDYLANLRGGRDQNRTEEISNYYFRVRRE